MNRIKQIIILCINYLVYAIVTIRKHHLLQLDIIGALQQYNKFLIGQMLNNLLIIHINIYTFLHTFHTLNMYVTRIIRIESLKILT